MKDRNTIMILCFVAASLLIGCSENTSPEAFSILESQKEEIAVMAEGKLDKENIEDYTPEIYMSMVSNEHSSDSDARATEATAVTEAETTATETVTTSQPDPTAPYIDYDADIDPEKPMLCLTFDDGPSDQTEQILNCLEEYDSHATFFVVGSNITEYNGKTLKRAAELGCEIGNHTYNHANLVKAGIDLMDSEIQKTDDLVYQHTGRYTYWLRPPYGAFNDEVRSNVEKPLAFWSIDTLDWSTKDSKSTISSILSEVKDGDVILMHDLYEETTEATLDVIPELVERGYQLVTMSELAYYRDFDVSDGMLLIDLNPDDFDYYPAPDDMTEVGDMSVDESEFLTGEPETETVYE